MFTFLLPVVTGTGESVTLFTPDMRWIVYNVLFTLGYLLMVPGFLLRMMRRGGYRRHFRHRFGRYGAITRARMLGVREGGAKPTTDDRPIWIHAVSVGEVYVAWQVMHAMRSKRPGLRFVLSTTSSTGWREAEKRIRPEDVLIYCPLDFPFCVRRALAAIQPRAFLLTESEIWPNLIRACSVRGIPVFLVNGRISDRSAPRYRLLRYWFGPVLRQFTQLLVQSDLDRQRLLDAGADGGRVVVTGSVKFDVARRDPAKEQLAAALLCQLGMGSGCTILLGGSTWPGEEVVLLNIYQKLQPKFPELRLVLIPRHFERADVVAAAISAAGLTCIRKSLLDAGVEPAAQGAQAVLLVNTTGEMMGFYAQASIVFVGKSLCAHGAQNMIEPCLCGKATVIGPFTENFRPVMADLLAAQAIVQVPDLAALEREIDGLLAEPARREELGRRAAAAVQRRRGVIGRCADLILQGMP
ncbi:MAG: 3-deoxy-D-manno-octulosonic acid transferase [Kiritimatiellia bacterium]